MGVSRQEHWSELPCTPPGALPDPGIEPVSPSPALQANSLLLSHQESPEKKILIPLRLVYLSIILGFPGGSAVKNPLAMQEVCDPSLGWEEPLEKEMATYPCNSVWRFPHGQRSLAGLSPWGHKESDMTK